MRLPAPRFYVVLDKGRILVRDHHRKLRDEEYPDTRYGSDWAHRRAKLLNRLWESGMIL